MFKWQIVVALAVALSAIELVFPTVADAQSVTVRCKVRPDFPASFCCKQCVAWGKAPAGTLVGPCIKWMTTNGRCSAASGVR
jgi:hypothetical protein